MDSPETIHEQRQHEEPASGCQAAAVLQGLRAGPAADGPGQSTGELVDGLPHQSFQKLHLVDSGCLIEIESTRFRMET